MGKDKLPYSVRLDLGSGVHGASGISSTDAEARFNIIFDEGVSRHFAVGTATPPRRYKGFGLSNDYLDPERPNEDIRVPLNGDGTSSAKRKVRKELFRRYGANSS